MEGGSKIPLSRLWELLEQDGISSSSVLWPRIMDCLLIALYAAQPKIPNSPNCFELYGADLMIDSDLRVWLIEINPSPSMSLDTDLDKLIKPRLVRDTISLVGPVDFDRQSLADHLESRLSGGVNKLARNHESAIYDVLHGQRPRQFGELPKECGLFDRLAPSKRSNALIREIRSFKAKKRGASRVML